MHNLFRIITNLTLYDYLTLAIAVGIFVYIASSAASERLRHNLQVIGASMAALGIGGFLVSFLLHVDIRFSMMEFSPPKTTRSQEPPGVSAPGRKVGKDPQKSTFHEVARWQGNGPKRTETFQIPSDEWMIEWETKPLKAEGGMFTIMVHSPATSFGNLVTKAQGERNNNIVMHGSGKYYLNIEANQPYKVVVSAKY